ncbi:MAG: DUF3179 domain-containing protein [Wenzhouxiangellaceae bacterium]|nr:DUF3179 domain-containing protein [Wenzhouxiangellaceae bacterium]
MNQSLFLQACLRRVLVVIALVLAVIAAVPTAAQDTASRVEFPKTDFTNTIIDFDEIRSGGPPRDGIPALDAPRFIPAARANWLHPDEPAIVVSVGDDWRAYPLQILIWHEIVNDVVGGKPLAVTFCPLCNASLVFEREFNGRVLDFGTTGRLRKSDLVMYDRQSETWWQQFTGTGLIGTYAGRELTEHPASIVRFGDFVDAHPDGRVLDRRTGHNRPYGENPYRGYDRVGQSPFLFDDPVDERLPAMERVLAVREGEASRAYPFGAFTPPQVVNDMVGGRPVAVFAADPAFSALDQRKIQGSRKVASLNAYDRRVDGRTLTFETREDRFFDRETGSRWNALGQAVEGELAGRRLEPVAGGVHFAFAWLAFRPETQVWSPTD